MGRMKTGSLVAIRDDYESPCFIVKSDSLLESDVMALTPSEELVSPRGIVYRPIIQATHKDYEGCMLVQSNTGTYAPIGSLFRSPELPMYGLFLSKRRVKFKNSDRPRRYALILGGEKKFLIPLHFIATASTNNSI